MVKKDQNEQAYETLKEDIVTLRLAPGDFLITAQLMARYGLGRTPVNHAIHRLADDKLVQIVPRKGIIVAPLSLDEALDLIAVRMVTEKLCLQLAAKHITAQQLEALKDAQERYVKASESNNVVKALDADRAFHEVLADASGNQVLPGVLKHLHARSQRFWALSLDHEQHSREVIEEHNAIIAALEERDGEAALIAIERHILSFHQTFFGAISSPLGAMT